MTVSIPQKIRLVREQIRDVCAQDSENADLRLFIDQRLPQLHYAISATRAQISLHDFILRYIAQIPEFIEIIYKVALDNDFLIDIELLIKIATDYFLSPPSAIQETQTMLSLLDEAYLAHRLLEEINDRLMAQIGAPLLPMDSTTANLIVHDIIGEPFANELDAAALFASDTVFNNATLSSSDAMRNFAQQNAAIGWENVLARWPSLAENLGLTLSFASTRSGLQ